MYGCTTVVVFAVSLLVLSTGFTVASAKDFSLYRKYPDCAEREIIISVKCPLDRRRRITATETNRSSCCLFSVYNSSHPSETCVSMQEPDTLSKNAKNSEIAARPESTPYILRTCEGSSVRLLCDVNATASCSDVVRWRSLMSGSVVTRRSFPLSNVQKEDAGTYACEVTDAKGRVRQTGTVTVEVQFAPIITVPNSSVSIWTETENVLECQSEASPKPTITWYRDGIILTPSPSLYAISSENTDCRTTSYVFFKIRNASSYASEDMVLQNYTCLAENELGTAVATFLIASFIEEASINLETGGRRRFNVTGFIVGMLPPLFISFYIIVKLGYRSRYAEERGEDDGYTDEPFFISY